MNDIQNQLMDYGDLPLNIARGTDRGPWGDRISPAPGSDLAKLWDDPSGYPVGLIELSAEDLLEIFKNRREFTHVFEDKQGLVIDGIKMKVVKDKRWGNRLVFEATRQYEGNWRPWELTSTELRVHERTVVDFNEDNDSMIFRPFFGKDGTPQWQMMRRVVTITQPHTPEPDTVPAYLNYYFKNLTNAICDGLKTDDHGYLLNKDDEDDEYLNVSWEDVEAEFVETALKLHPLGVYNFIPTDPSLIDWFLSTKASIADGALDYTQHGKDAIIKLVRLWGEQFCEMAEPFVQSEMANNPTLKREIAKQDVEGSINDDDEDDI